MGLAVAFLDAGWEADNVIGQPPVLVNRLRPTDRIWPFVVVRSLCEGTLTAEAWRARCQQLGSAGVHLGGGLADAHNSGRLPHEPMMKPFTDVAEAVRFLEGFEGDAAALRLAIDDTLQDGMGVNGP
jgi:hypothetical protein